jgi:exonuclease SbcC
MQLLKLEVRNWVHHRYRVCEFTRGLVAILGENGSGKSSLFGAIRWLLTGENPNYGVKADNVSQYAKPGEASNATLEFEHNGHYATVTRHLLPEKEQATLTIDGKEVARGDKMVTAGVEKLLGVDSKFISRFIIVGQTDIFSFIDDNQTDTDKFFQRLFNTSKADKCQDVIGKGLLKLSVPEIVKSSAQLLLEQQAVGKDIATLDGQIGKLPTLNAFLQQQETEQAVIQQWEARQKASGELQQLLQTAAQYKKEITEADTLCEQYAKDLTAFSSVVDGKEETHRDAKIALGHWENYKKIAQVKDRIQRQRAEIAAERAANPEPPEVEGQSAEHYRHEAEACRRIIKNAERFVAMFTEAGVAECPTCHTPSSQLAQQVAEQRAHIVTMTETLAYVLELEHTQAEAEKQQAEWDLFNTRLLAREKQLDASAADLVSVTPPDTTEEELQQAVSDFEDFQAAKNELQPLMQKTREQSAKTAGALAAVEARQQQLLEDINSAKATEADAQMSKARLASMRELCTQRAQLEQQRAQLAFDHQKLGEQHDSVKKQEADAVRMRQWQEVASRARDALKNAPRLVAQRNLQRLEAAINELLQIFQVNFLVKVAGDGTPTFVAEFYDGRKQVAQRLSIGQKTVLALAFRVAVNAQFAEEIGLLALDEPTASLDAPRIQALAPVLEKLRDLSTAKGLQCLLVTHASSLSHLFESTIELEPPELRHARNAR